MMSQPREQAAPDALVAMSADDFRELVEDSVGREADPALWDTLTDPAVISRTRRCLGGIHQDLLAQLALRNTDLDEYHAECLARGEQGRRDWFARKGEEAEWRGRLAGYRRMVERRIAFVNSRIERKPQTPFGAGGTKNARKHNRAALETLTRAVMEHKRAVTSGDGDESDDERLWACLARVTAIAADGEEMPLAEWLEYLDDLRESEGGDQ
jgi:hypothetical protein